MGLIDEFWLLTLPIHRGDRGLFRELLLELVALLDAERADRW